uniref:HNH nuclease domain-containing protein n=1 Tax=viral metagenome TaxID=1070528 RepID=A0A6C0CN52_9ZZZZ
MINLLRQHKNYIKQSDTGCEFINPSLSSVVYIKRKEIVPNLEICKEAHPSYNFRKDYAVKKCKLNDICFNPSHISTISKKEQAWDDVKNKLELLKNSIDDPINDCWILKDKTIDKDGYIKIQINKKNLSLHRVSYMIYNDKTLNTSTIITHTCANKHCCNPHHLKIKLENDTSSPNNHPNSDISNDLALKIINSKGTNMSRKDKSEHFGVSVRSIERIEQFQTFKHLRSEKELNEFNNRTKRVTPIKKIVQKPPQEKLDNKYNEMLKHKTEYKNNSVNVNTPCWGWKSKSLSSTVLITYNKEKQMIHTFSWKYNNNKWDKIPKTHKISHKCNNKGCWNPDHLELSQLKTK